MNSIMLDAYCKLTDSRDLWGKAPSNDVTSNDPLPAEGALQLVRESFANLMSGGVLVDNAARNGKLVFPGLPLGISDHLPDRYLLALS